MARNRERLVRDFIDLGREILRWDRRSAYGADWSHVAPPPAISLASPGRTTAEPFSLRRTPGMASTAAVRTAGGTSYWRRGVHSRRRISNGRLRVPRTDLRDRPSDRSRADG